MFVLLAAALYVGGWWILGLWHAGEDERLRLRKTQAAANALWEEVAEYPGRMMRLTSLDPLEYALNGDGPDHRTGVILDAARELLAASAVFLLDDKGMPVMTSPREHIRLVSGNSLAYRSYFREAMQGRPSVSLELSAHFRDIGAYIAAPVHAGRANPVGIAVCKLDSSRFDKILEAHPVPMALLSPEGIVFATNQPDWTLRTAAPLSTDEARRLGPGFRNESVDALPVDISKDRVTHDGRDMLVRRAEMPGLPGWRLAALFPARDLFAPERVLPAASLLMAALAVLALAYRERAHSEDTARLQAERALRRANEQLEERVAARTEELERTNTNLRQEMDARLRAEEEAASFGHMLDASLNEIYLLDPENLRILHANRGAARKLGYDAQRLTSMRLREIIRDFDGLRVPELISPLLSGELEQVELEAEMRHKDGSTSITHGTLQSMDLHGKRVLLLVGADVTSRRRAESALRASEALFRSLVEEAPVGIVLTDLDGRLREVNPAMERMLGYEHGELVGLGLSTLYDADDLRELPLQRQRIIDEGTVRLERRLRRKDGGVFPVLTVARMLSKDAVLLLYQDMTREKRLLRDQEEARIQAENVSLAKSQFLANMSHEIRTPLHGMLGMAELLLADTKNPSLVEEYAGNIREAGTNLLSLLEDILDMARIEADRLSVEEAPVELRPLARSVLGMFAIEAGKRDLSLTFEPAPDLPELVYTDQGRLRQVLVNLVGNAVKFTERGAVTVIARPTEQGSDRVLFEVRDTGPGIPPEQQEAMFEVFRQADASYSRPKAGSGLGLTISRKLAGLLGGWLWVESTPGQGSSFFLTITARPVDSASAPPPAEPRDTSPMRVLLAEDNRVNQLMTRRMLERHGHSVLTASDGDEALDILARERVDLVLMDISMPRLDGLEATRRIRRGGAVLDPSVPVVALTAHAMTGDREEFLAEGMDAYLAKPFEWEDLAWVLADLSPRRE
ncbi:PAS domain S-box protein [Desulfohalovibrio reitneri]|uniref:PAS domain S-box protein n=1 Tax=Desulfohalovibrio reitneri TaxID=1307759 RepID=UPI000A522C2E|nr:PAS domain S-box protein [Desulfohalovibrio reitneri]